MSLLVVGSGVFGLSTAIEAARKGYSVVAIDKHSVPSPYSAAYDFNKIIRSEYDSPMYAKMSLDAMDIWTSDPKFSKTYFECGRLSICPTSNAGRRKFDDTSIEVLTQLGKADKIRKYTDGETLKKDLECLKDCEFSENDVYVYNGRAGFAHAANALKAAYEIATDLGVKFVFGEAGEATKIIEEDGKSYVLTKSGAKYTADRILVTCGASTGYVINMGGIQSASGVFVTHVQLTPEEAKKMQDIPIIFDAGLGYFFPPDLEKRLVKICVSGTAAAHTVDNPHAQGKVSLPRYKKDSPTDTIPKHMTLQARKLLGRYFPELAAKPFVDSKTCWLADSSNSDFIIDKVPDYKNVYVASGDSGHGFKFLPNIGQYILKLLDGQLDQEIVQKWKWRPEIEGVEKYEKTNWKLTKELLDFNKIDFVEESTGDSLS
ncbi:hypothetical protein OGAPHI_000905 [Ogataea philodendri]|uniref:FAD dependent oxidoreductase domain-containing protein n=1 Tax=Ogataea philodendri TaxID=1378263 RepID=A0A9P8PF35_9ASCO|nr:uncharacterized protein OGAPHI_000905 [Ogataea philodendri]KAH3670390.1 hypothetical protein OGAPHI_000905 [Ogataea philodendri]